MTTRSIWVIRENQTKSWCKSSKHGYFGDFVDAVIFASEANALKAIKNLQSNPGQQLSVGDKHYLYGDLSLVDEVLALREGFDFIRGNPSYEAVECVITIP